MRNIASLLLDRMRDSSIPCSIESLGGGNFNMKVGDKIYYGTHLSTEEAIEKFLQFHIGETIKKDGYI
jgi:hypothetical protein